MSIAPIAINLTKTTPGCRVLVKLSGGAVLFTITLFVLNSCTTRDGPTEITTDLKPDSVVVEIPDSPMQSRVVREAFIPDTQLTICPGMRVSNAPESRNRVIAGFNPYINIRGMKILRAPVKDACLSSGYGQRGSRLHKGVDYHQRPAGPVFAAASGVILEKVSRRDYGNMLLIDHGNNVYTRYAHLADFADGIKVNATVNTGTILGTMGNTGAVKAVHLHYEILSGNYSNPKRSFGLDSINPFLTRATL